MDRLLSLNCFQPHYLNTPDDNTEETSTSPTNLRFWENWNTRTRSTVQYVGCDASASSNGRHTGKQRSGEGDEEEDGDAYEEEEEDADAGAVYADGNGVRGRRSPQISKTLTYPTERNTPRRESSKTYGESDISHRSVADVNSEHGTPRPMSGFGSIRLSEGRRSVELDDYWKTKDKVGEYCVFKSLKNVELQDVMLYEEFHSFPENMMKHGLESIEDYRCDDKNCYMVYLMKSKLDTLIDPVNCLAQQQEMNCLYHIKHKDQEFDRDTSGCVLINVYQTEKESFTYENYLDCERFQRRACKVN